tara:strand:+ start:976 stop:1389 length:414 start_codon:yes stop_codon:yes gene_type:complete
MKDHDEELFNIFRKFKEVTDSKLSFEEFKQLNRAYQKHKKRRIEKHLDLTPPNLDWNNYKSAMLGKKNKKSSNKKPKPESPQAQINELLDSMNGASDSEIIEIKNKINKITNNGTQIKGLFNNPYYVGHTDPSKFNV